MKLEGCPIFIEVRPIACQLRNADHLAMPSSLSFFSLGTPALNAAVRTKARQGQSDGESGEGFLRVLHRFQARFCWSRPAADESSSAYMARPRCRLLLRPSQPRVLLRRPTEQPFGTKEFIAALESLWHRVTRESRWRRSAFKATEPFFLTKRLRRPKATNKASFFVD